MVPGVFRNVMSPTPRRALTPFHRAGASARSLRRSVGAFGFWIAVVLPVVYPAVLVAGAWFPAPRTLLIGLLAVHVAALLVGRHHRRGDER